MRDPFEDQRTDKLHSGAGDYLKALRRAWKEGRRQRRQGRPAPSEADLQRLDEEERSRARGGSDYAVHVIAGRVAEHRLRGFGLVTDKGAWFIRAHRKERPPVGFEGPFALTGGKAIWLAGYPDDEGQWRAAERTWRQLLGRSGWFGIPALGLLFVVMLGLTAPTESGLPWHADEERRFFLVLFSVPLVILLWYWARRARRIRRNENGLRYQLGRFSENRRAQF